MSNPQTVGTVPNYLNYARLKNWFNNCCDFFSIYDVTWAERKCVNERMCTEHVRAAPLLSFSHVRAHPRSWLADPSARRHWALQKTTWHCSRTAERSKSDTFERRVWDTRFHGAKHFPRAPWFFREFCSM